MITNNRENCKILTKPSLVDFLRLCDRNNWCSPRIRYASIRSKPELIEDLIKFFRFERQEEFIQITPRHEIFGYPEMKYHIRTRRFHRDGIEYDCATKSRQKPTFRLEKKKCVLHFGTLYPLCNGRVAAFSAMFPAQG